MSASSIRAVISGGASGLGLAVARKMVAAGGRVALVDLNAEKGAAAVTALGAECARYFASDVTDEDGVAAMMAAAHQWLDGLTVAVNCAGILGSARTLGRNGPMPLDNFRTTVMVNLIGSFNLAKAAANLMQHNPPDAGGGRGVIINTASVAAFDGQVGQAAYAASKGGVVGMTLPLAREFARFGIRVMTIAPGIFHTPMVDGMPQAVQDSLSASIPFPPRLGQPDEFAALALHIIENPYLNGEIIRLDGAVRLSTQ